MIADQQANPTAEPSTAQSFRERKTAQLQQELESQPGAVEDTSPDPIEQDADEDQRETEGMLAEESEDQTETDSTEEALPDSAEAEGEEAEAEAEVDPQLTEWQEKAEAAETARKSMETDYRRKTHKLAEASRAVQTQAEAVETTAQYLMNQAQAELAQYQNVNWQTLPPEQHQQMQAGYMQAQQSVQQRQMELEQIHKTRQQYQAQQDSQIAEHSKGVLLHRYADWGAEKYTAAREFAEREYDFTPDEFDKVVDWRVMAMAVDALEAKTTKKEAAKVIKKVGKKRGTKRPGRTASGQKRNAQGQFQAAKEQFRKTGDRAAFREMKRRQLEVEGRR